MCARRAGSLTPQDEAEHDAALSSFAGRLQPACATEERAGRDEGGRVQDSFAIATEEELYAEIARAWCRIHPPAARVRHPMQPFAVSPAFTSAVWGQREDYAQKIIAVCARIISRRQPHGEGAQQVSALTATPRESLDPATAWWQALPELGELGLHFWVLGNGTIELSSLAPYDEPSPPEYGRFADALHESGGHARNETSDADD
jgi:hypothetical protein